jgi:hypothetical protein
MKKVKSKTKKAKVKRSGKTLCDGFLLLPFASYF